ncbi:hypothetical protein [Dietzia sp. B19]|uniref:hypothetical protein n=1 Tax=Dietzia sp. B19 TaxID=1630632 RepID=UPI00321F856B
MSAALDDPRENDMSGRLLTVCGMAAVTLLAGAGTANAQLGSVTGSLPGSTSGPVGSTATAVCNVGSVANLAGAGLPTSAVCSVAPALGRSIDHLLAGDTNGSVSALVGGVPGVGSALERVVPTDSAADLVDQALAGIDATSLTPQG